MPEASGPVIRAFRAADAPGVSTLIAATMRISNARDYPRELLERAIAYYTPAKLRALARERHCLVALVEGRVVGTAAREGDALATFFVHPDHQGRGIGTRLLASLEREARRAGLAELRVPASVTGASFYERCGYRRVGTIEAGPAAPQVVLVKELHPGDGVREEPARAPTRTAPR
ncbi:MAG TPA: GNAT family N-acetyltransferase [Gemmatimonadaceae bacterium]|nr:GNAT family N-acetyltransferase [Gemmatimonadaceae bacterium]